MKDFSSDWSDTEAANGLFRAAFAFALPLSLPWPLTYVGDCAQFRARFEDVDGDEDESKRIHKT